MDDLLITTLITAFVTLIAVALSHVISEYRNFRHAKFGLIDEINYNLATITFLVEIIGINNQENLQEIIKKEIGRISNYLDDYLPRIQTSSFQYFSQQGYLIKINRNAGDQLFAIYMNFLDINRVLGTHKLIEFESELVEIHSHIIKRISDIDKIATPDFIDKLKGVRFL
jgi:hypothetical protein